MALRLRPLTAEESTTIQRLARARAAPARRVERAQMVWRAAQGEAPTVIAAALGCNVETVRLWLRRFNAAGLDGLRDRSRTGRPPTYTADQIGTVLATALSEPADLDQPFGSWTLDRLQVYLNEVAGIPIKRSRIDEILIGEGLRWRSQETWFGERVDPAFAEKRGRSSRSTRRHLRTVS
jgi:transposase